MQPRDCDNDAVRQRATPGRDITSFRSKQFAGTTPFIFPLRSLMASVQPEPLRPFSPHGAIARGNSAAESRGSSSRLMQSRREAGSSAEGSSSGQRPSSDSQSPRRSTTPAVTLASPFKRKSPANKPSSPISPVHRSPAALSSPSPPRTPDDTPDLSPSAGVVGCSQSPSDPSDASYIARQWNGKQTERQFSPPSVFTDSEAIHDISDFPSAPIPDRGFSSHSSRSRLPPIPKEGLSDCASLHPSSSRPVNLHRLDVCDYSRPGRSPEPPSSVDILEPGLPVAERLKHGQDDDGHHLTRCEDEASRASQQRRLISAHPDASLCSLCAPPELSNPME